jgi:6-phosphogluconolactonase
VTRSFNITPDGRHLIAAGQTSGNLAVFRVGEDGSLTRTSTTKAGAGPWWVQVVER